MIAITFPLKTLIVRGLINDVSIAHYEKDNGDLYHKLTFNGITKHPLEMWSHVNEKVFGALSLNHVTIRVPTDNKVELDAFIKHYLRIFTIPETTCYVVQEKKDSELVDHFLKEVLAYTRDNKVPSDKRINIVHMSTEI